MDDNFSEIKERFCKINEEFIRLIGMHQSLKIDFIEFLDSKAIDWHITKANKRKSPPEAG